MHRLPLLGFHPYNFSYQQHFEYDRVHLTHQVYIVHDEVEYKFLSQLLSLTEKQVLLC